jgi:DNA-binding GntR family transcriptional regulator
MDTLGYASIVSRKTILEHEAVLESMEREETTLAEALLKEHIAKDEQRFKRRANSPRTSRTSAD